MALKFTSNLRLILAIGLTLIALGGCELDDRMTEYSIAPGKSAVNVGESRQLTPMVRHGFKELGGCTADDPDFSEDPTAVDPADFTWSVSPATGAVVGDTGVFRGSKPGTYVVSVKVRENKKHSKGSKFYNGAVVTVRAEETRNDEAPDGTSYLKDEPEGEPVKIFSVGSDLAVQNGGTPPSFTMDKEHWVTELWTYHWNDGAGAAPGTIALKSSDGKTFGPWKAKLYNKVYWVAKPAAPLPPGTYTVIDSDPATMAQNSETQGRGMAWMHGIPAP